METKRYKILIADDEGIVIESLSLIINRHFGDKCIINSGKTGRQVIEIAEEFRPDIIFMDIQMPGINGIDAMKEIKKINKSTIFIVISAYDKFTYAKEAIHLGVIDYLTKPTNKKKIITTLEKAMSIVDTAKEKRSTELAMKEKLRTVIPIIESGMIYSILFRDVYATEFTSFKNLLGIESNYGFIFAIQYGDLDEKGVLTNSVGVSVRAQSFYPILCETTKEFFDGIIGPIMLNQVVVFVPWEDSEINYNQRIDIIEKCRGLIRKLNRKIDTDFRIGIGSVKKLDELSASYKEAILTTRQNIGKVVHIEDVSTSNQVEDDYPETAKKNIINKMRSGDLVGTKVEAELFFEWLLAHKLEYELDIPAKIYEIILYLEERAYHLGVKTYHFSNRGNYFKKSFETDTVEKANSGRLSESSLCSIKEWFLEKIVEIYTNINTQMAKQTNSKIIEANNYILKFYYKDISLDDVSREVDISPYYFSKLYKEETGENFIDYLTKIRINKAKELLEDNSLSIKEICISVGYSDPNYFSRIFKKCTGITPTRYREKKLH